MEVSNDTFAALVAEAWAALPDAVRRRAADLPIVIESAPTPDDYHLNEVPEDEDLFGLFEGIPLTESDVDGEVRMPNRIRIFQIPHEDACDSLAALRDEVRQTVHHEVAHHFGIEDDRLLEIGAY
jgi:predicted Zn-dependent protease with MMP-like domain